MFEQYALSTLKIPFSAEDTAFIIIDLQPDFFDPDYRGGGGLGTKFADNVARKIVSLLPVIRKTGMPVYAVGIDTLVRPEDMEFYRYKPEPSDYIVIKNTASAVLSGRVADENGLWRDNFVKSLKDRGFKNLIICGGLLSGCVNATVRDSLPHFNICVIDNLTTDGNKSPVMETLTKMDMQQKGVEVASAAAVVRNIPTFSR